MIGDESDSTPQPMSIAEKFVAMEYGPAPEDPERGARLAGPPRPPLRTFHRRRVATAGGRGVLRNHRSLDRRKAGQRRAGIGRGHRRRGESRARCVSRNGRRSLRTRGRAICMRWRGTVQKHSRRLAVLETMDNGKPIRESRDIDIPLVARHFYHHAGWAQLLQQEFPGLHGLRRRRTDHSLEFSAADAGLEDCAGAGHGKHGRAEAGGVHAADRAGLRRNLPGDRTARRASSTS